MLESINYIVCSTMFVIASIIYANILLEKKQIKITKKLIIILVLEFIIYTMITRFSTGTFKTLLVFFFHVIQYRHMFKIEYFKSIILSFLFIVLTIIPEMFLLFFLIKVLGISPEVCDAQFTNSFISTTIVGILLIIMVYIIRKPLRNLIKIKIDDNKQITIYTILTLGCIVILFYTIVKNVLITENVVIGILIMIIFVVILYSLMKQKLENNKILEKYDKLLEFIKKYEIIIEEQREIRHESKNQLITVKSKVLNKEDGEEIIKYVDSLLNDHKGYREDKYVMFQYLPSNGIKGLFYYKAMEAEEKEINLSIRISERVENSVLSELETEDFKQLGRLVGVYLDNAIEASCSSEERKLGIEIYKHKEDVIIIISNTYSGEIDEESLGKVRYSTKGNNHGYGLLLVNKILSKSDKFISEHKITDKLFVQKLVIKKSIN